MAGAKTPSPLIHESEVLSGNRHEGQVEKMTNQKGKVYLVGAGPGDPGLITVKGRDCIRRADVLVYDYLANESFLEFAHAHAECI